MTQYYRGVAIDVLTWSNQMKPSEPMSHGHEVQIQDIIAAIIPSFLTVKPTFQRTIHPILITSPERKR